ncbi:MAG: ABC transporter substrate binding protein [Reyranellaceae bacterium]
MKRRKILGAAAGVAAAWPLHGLAKQMQRVAVLTPSHLQWQPRTFRDALSELGYREGINSTIEAVSGENHLERLPALAKELVVSAPDVIVAVNTPGTRAAIAATNKIPIVSAMVADPVLLGIVGSIARPEGNVTGIANMATDITSKRVALLNSQIARLDPPIGARCARR